MKRLSGAWFKLVDDAGICIGLLMVPERVAGVFEGGEFHVRCYRHPGTPPVTWSPEMMNEAVVEFRFFLISQSWRYNARDALELQMITPEEIATEPGYAFIPSAEYLRRPAVVETPERKPEPPGKHLAAAREVAG